MTERGRGGRRARVGPVVAYDLPIAVGVLAASGQLPGPTADRVVFLGELSLDGALRHTEGILPMVAIARERGVVRAFVPTADAPEARLVDGVEVVPVTSLARLVDVLRIDAPLELAPAAPRRDDGLADGVVDFADVEGQERVKRALEVAAAGTHKVLRISTGCPHRRA